MEPSINKTHLKKNYIDTFLIKYKLLKSLFGINGNLLEYEISTTTSEQLHEPQLASHAERYMC